MIKVNVTEDIYYIGVNDRKTHLFENHIPIPQGMAYNSYIIVDEKIALMDTVERSFVDEYLDNIKNTIGDRKIDYLVINHMEPDHTGAIKTILKEYPEIIIVGNKKTFPLLEAFYYIGDNIIEVKEGDELSLGKHTLQFYFTPMVHWPESMVSYEKHTGALFSADAFGSFGTLDGGVFDDEINLDFYEDEMIRYFSNIVGKYCGPTQKAIKKLAGLDIKLIAPLHGPVWRSDLNWVMSRYDKWSKYELDKGVLIVYGSMYGNTEKIAEALARGLAERGIKNIRIYDSSKTHPSYIIRDLWKYKGFMIGSVAYNHDLFPTINTLVNKIEGMKVKNHLLGIFGSFSWNGGGVKNLKKFADNIGWDLVYDPIEEKGSLKGDKLFLVEEMANAMADRLHELYPED